MKLLPLIIIPFLLSGCGSDSGTSVGTDAGDQTATDTDTADSDTDAGSGNGDADGDTDDGSTNDSDPDPVASEATARYRLTFSASWSAQTHAQDFPGNPHFSGLVGAVHNEQIIFWESGQIATNGIEEVAESGAKTLMLEEVNAAIANGYATASIDGGGVATSPGVASIEFEVSRDYPQVTVTTMVAPSPDWFVGVHNLALFDGTAFVDSITRDLAVYDAGTDSGVAYTSGDEDSAPRDPIGLLSSDPANAPFIDGVPSVGQFIFEKLP